MNGQVKISVHIYLYLHILQLTYLQYKRTKTWVEENDDQGFEIKLRKRTIGCFSMI